jgi:hypothetical protein
LDYSVAKLKGSADEPSPHEVTNLDPKIRNWLGAVKSHIADRVCVVFKEETTES